MDTAKALDAIEEAIKEGPLCACEAVHRQSQVLRDVQRDDLIELDIGTLYLDVIKGQLLPACRLKRGEASAACLTVHCAHFINIFWDLMGDDPDKFRRAIWKELIQVIYYFVRALDTVARRQLSFEARILPTGTVDASLKLVNSLIDYDRRAMDHMIVDETLIGALQVFWKMYLVPPVITGELPDI